MEYHYLYQIVSLVPDENGVCKIYSGVRTSEVEPEIDEYFGSGRRLKAAVKKHGRDKFIKTIVARFDTREEAYNCETQWLNKLFTKFYGSSWEKFNRHHYNLRLNENSQDSASYSDASREKMSNAKRGKYDGENNPMYGVRHSDETRQKQSAAKRGKYVGASHPKYGKKLSAETIVKISENHADVTGGENGNFKGFSIGFNKTTGGAIVFDGRKSMSDRKFSPSQISSCISGHAKSHKNFTFTRSTDENYLRQLLEQDNFFDEQSKTIIQIFLQ